MPNITLNFYEKPANMTFDIYRVEGDFNLAKMGTPLITNFNGQSYVDSTIQNNKIYQYALVTNNTNEVSNITVIDKIETTDQDSLFSYVDFKIGDLGQSGSVVKDSSSSNRTITKNGNDSTWLAPYFSTKKGFYVFNRLFLTDGKLKCNLSKKLLTSDFTIEIIAAMNFFSNYHSNNRFFQIGSTSSSLGTAPGIWVTRSNSSSNIEFTFYNGSTYIAKVSSKTIVSNKYYNICLMRKDGIFYLFLDGERVGLVDGYKTMSVNASDLYIFCSGEASAEKTSGALDSFRVTLDVARYNVNGYSITTMPFTKGVNDQYFNNVEVLLDGSDLNSKSSNNTFKNLAPSNISIDAPKGGFSIYNNTSSGYILNSSMYYNNSYIVNNYDIGTSDFTIEISAMSNIVTDKVLLSLGAYTANGSITILYTGNGDIYAQFQRGDYLYDRIELANQYNYLYKKINICIMRKNGVIYCFVDGVFINSIQITYTILTNLYIGSGSDSGSFYNYYDGLISDIRITKTARYDTKGYSLPIKHYNK